MGNETITLSNQETVSVINTLKEIKPRGFKSMDRLVGLVMFFESKLNSMPMAEVGEEQNGVK